MMWRGGARADWGVDPCSQVVTVVVDWCLAKKGLVESAREMRARYSGYDRWKDGRYRPAFERHLGGDIPTQLTPHQESGRPSKDEWVSSE